MLHASHDIKRTCTALERGGLVILPTDTVYGLAADATSTAALKRLYELKQRPADKPVSLLAADQKMAESYAVFDRRARSLAESFWPGGLTMILQAREKAPLDAQLMAGGTSLGLRVPAHDLAHQLLETYGQALAVSSANRSGAPAPTRIADMAPAMLKGVDMVLDGGPCAHGVASAIVDLTGEAVQVLRDGKISREMIAKALENAWT